jgi:hypothetical protein
MTGLEQFDDAFDVKTEGRPATTAVIPNGYYTLVFPDGSHRTFKIITRMFGLRQRVLSMLIGPENTTDFEPFAWVDDNGVHVWKRFRGSKHEEYGNLLWMLATGCEADAYQLLISKRCLLCNRPLTTPLALNRGLGDKCYSRTLASRQGTP